jgi:hypothetical protein
MHDDVVGGAGTKRVEGRLVAYVGLDKTIARLNAMVADV